MYISEIRKSGILKKGEEQLESKDGYMTGSGKGVLVITNKRFLFLKRPGIFSKGFHVIFECSLGNIVSVTITGLISKTLNVQIKNDNGEAFIYSYKVGNSELTEIFSDKLIGAKDEYIEEVTVEAQRVIIEEGNKDKAMQILQKRLARGEITLEEFHQLVQRL